VVRASGCGNIARALFFFINSHILSHLVQFCQILYNRKQEIELVDERIDVDSKDVEFYTLQEVANRLRVSYRSVYRWVHEGRLVAYQVGNREWRVRDVDLERFLEERRSGGKR
jgi:excisionase family DNA binding protein